MGSVGWLMTLKALAVNDPPTQLAVQLANGQSILATPVAIGGGGGSTFISVATAAALSALSVAGVDNGTPAYIASRTTLWSLVPGPIDAHLQAAGYQLPASDGRVWSYTAAANGEGELQKLNWEVDPSNVTGIASDDATGLPGAPLLTQNEILRRWGLAYYQNGLNGDVAGDPTVISFASGHPGVTDFAAWTPKLNQIPGASGGFLILRALPAARTVEFTGTLNTVTPKSHAGNNALEATFTTVTGAMAAGLYLVNNTRGGSVARAWRNSAGTWVLSQPLQAYAFPSFLVPVTPDNGWTSGDSITGYLLPSVNVSDFGAIPNGSTNATNAPFALLYNLRIAQGLFQFSGIGIILESDVTTQANFVLTSKLGCNFQNAYVVPSVIGGETAGFTFVAGAIGSTDPSNSSIGCSGRGTFSTDAIIGVNMAVQNAALENVYLDSGIVLSTDGFSQQVGLGAGTSLYGPGQLNCRSGTFRYVAGAVDLQLAALQCGGSATGYSQATAAGVTSWHGGISITPANLAAAAGAAGFGGLCTVGGATITDGSTP